MFLERLSIRGFRCYDDHGVEFVFEPGINIIVGENNAGKSAAIDALRLGFSVGSGRRELYVSDRDFHLHADGTHSDEIALDMVFRSLTADEEGVFFELLSVSTVTATAQLHVRYRREISKGAERIRTTIWGGDKEGQPVSFETLDLIGHVFLGALRDAERDLRPGPGSRVGQLLRKVATDDNDQRSISRHIVAANRSILKEDKIREVGDIVNTHLGSIEGGRLGQRIELGLVAPEFARIADSLRMLLPLAGVEIRASFTKDQWADFLKRYGASRDLLQAKVKQIGTRMALSPLEFSDSEKKTIGEDAYLELLDRVTRVFDLDQNGMGYNNLIYMGTILGDLKQRKKNEAFTYNALLVEEPEAHLHPQLQNLVFGFLKGLATTDEQRSNDRFPVQVFVTSHSPTLTSRADLDCLIVLHRNSEGRVVPTAIRDCPLEPSDKNDLRRYLDVTRSQLFFAEGVILTEGISEALLLPVFARRVSRRLDENAAELVNVAGVAFRPFARLFNSSENARRLDIPCAILTDDDRGTKDDDPNCLSPDESHLAFIGIDDTEVINRARRISAKLKKSEISARCKNARTMAGNRLLVRSAYKTFEYELASFAENIAPMLDALGEIRPRITTRLRELFATYTLAQEEQAVCMWLAVENCKAEFAQRLAARLEDEAVGFRIPSYILEAFRHIAPIESSGAERGRS